MAAPIPCTVYPTVPFVGIGSWIDNIKLCSFLLEPDTEVCLSGTVGAGSHHRNGGWSLIAWSSLIGP